MPTTLTGLLLFIVLLLPGFTYVSIRERATPQRRVSTFRETITIVTASIVSEIGVLGLFAILRSVWPQATPDVGKIIRSGADYFAAHYGLTAAWAAGLLAVAVLGAAGAAWLVSGRTAHPSTMSSWWLLFEYWYPKSDIHIGCVLDDGSWVEGRFGSFATSAEDSPDRDIILVEPIKYAPSRETDVLPYGAGVACISARRIVTMFVTCLSDAGQPDASTSSPARAEAEVGARASAVVAQHEVADRDVQAPAAARPCRVLLTPYY